MATEAPKTQAELLRSLFTKYNLIYDPNDPQSKNNDVYKHPHYTIITRSGIEKIQKQADIHVRFTIEYATDTTVIVRTVGWVGEDVDNKFETLSSASDRTCKNAYYAEMAEKRGLSRIVLKLADLYELGVYGEDEADSFGELVRGKVSPVKRAVVQKSEHTLNSSE